MTTEKPAQSGPLVVTAAIIRRGEEILIAQRKADSGFAPLMWEFPGGKLELFEKPEECLRREIREELNLDITVDQIFDVVSHVYRRPDGQRFHIILLCYFCTYRAGQIECLEVADAKWVRREELGDFPYAGADIPIVERLLGRN